MCPQILLLLIRLATEASADEKDLKRWGFRAWVKCFRGVALPFAKGTFKAFLVTGGVKASAEIRIEQNSEFGAGRKRAVRPRL